MILVYTGSGKGKTSASTGQAVRAHGQGLQVAFCQFMKRADQSGEQKVLASLLGERFHAGGKGFFRREDSREEHRAAALEVLEWAERAIDQADLVVMDECLYALGSDLLTDEELQRLIQKARRQAVHLVLSGRGVPDWLRNSADLITEMTPIKHPFEDGRTAERGIEF